MVELFEELAAQPQALRDVAACYAAWPDLLDFSSSHPGLPWILTGMGASYHAAWFGAQVFSALGLAAQAVETIDLLYYHRLPAVAGWTIYVSQSGSSGEVNPFFAQNAGLNRLAALTNNANSDLARQAHPVLPMMAGEETLIASKTYVNSLAVFWMLARRLAGAWDGTEIDRLQRVAGLAEDIFASAAQVRQRFTEFFDPAQPLLFLGHGPHAVTARQAAMGISEWAKIPALHAGLGAFRHGFIESVHPGTRVVIFAPPGHTQASALELAGELSAYGAEILLVVNGHLHSPKESFTTDPPLDEFLSPLLDILPVQIAVDCLARSQGVEPGFRFISKVVRKV